MKTMRTMWLNLARRDATNVSRNSLQCISVKITLSWQMETVSEGMNPKLFKFEYKYNVVPGVTSVGRYGSYLVRNIWSDDILNFVDNLMDEISKQPTDLNFMTLDQKCRLKYNVQSEFRKLKSEKKLSINKIHKVLDKYSLDLQKLGYSIDLLSEYSITDSLSKTKTSFENSVVTDLKVVNCTQYDNDIFEVEERIEIFTPEISMKDSEISRNVKNSLEIHISKYSDYGNIAPNSVSSDTFINSYESTFRSSLVNLSLNSLSIENGHQNEKLSYKERRVLKTNKSSSSWQISEDVSKTPTPTAQYLNAACIYSPSAGNHFGNSSHCTKHVDNVGLKSVECSELAPRNCSTYGYGNISFSESNYYESNESLTKCDSPKYNNYVSPIIEIMKGMNNTTLSWEEDRESVIENSKKVNIIADITIDAACERVPFNLELNNGDFKNTFSENFNLRSGGETLNSTLTDSNIQRLGSVSERNIFITDCDEIPKTNSCNTRDIFSTISFSGKIQNENNHEKSNKFMSGSTDYKIGETRKINVIPTTESPITVDDSEKEMYNYLDTDTIDADALVTDVKTMLNSSIMENSVENTVFYNGCTGVDKQSSCTSISSASKRRKLDQASPESTNKTTDTSVYKKSEEKLNEVEYFEENEITIEKVSLGLDYISDACCKSDKSTSFIEENCDCQVKRSPFLNVLQNENVKIISEWNNTVAFPGISSASNKSSNQTFTRSIGKIIENANDEVKIKQFENTHYGVSIPKKRKMTKDNISPQKKLSAKEIRKEFEEQDRRILDCYPNSSNISKYLEQIINRPTIKQIQNSTQLVLIRKHNDSLQVISTNPLMRNPKYSHYKKHYSNEDFNMSIFSDKNAKPFEEYLNSNERDYETFRFNRNMLSEYSITDSFFKGTCTFASLKRTAKDSKFEINKIKDDDIEKYSTKQYPDLGIYSKKTDMNIIINKYLKENTFESSLNLSDHQTNEKNNIFDNNNLSCEDWLV